MMGSSHFYKSASLLGPPPLKGKPIGQKINEKATIMEAALCFESYTFITFNLLFTVTFFAEACYSTKIYIK